MTTVVRVAIALDRDKWCVVIVQEDVAGYVIDATKTASTWLVAKHVAQTANEVAGVSPEETWRILESSMAASRAAGTRWGPRGA